MQRRHEHHFEARAVIPISVSLGIAAVGIVSPLRRGIRCDAPIYQRLAILGRTLQSCQRAEYHSRVAHLVPVVLGAEKPRVPVVLRGAEPLLVYRRADYAARTARQTAVKPVVTDGDRHRHLAHVQEMRGIPILELADGQHLALGAGGIAVVGGNQMGVRQIKNSAQSLARHRQQAAARHLAPNGFGRKHLVGLGDYPFVDGARVGRLRRQSAHRLRVARAQQQTRMGRHIVVIERLPRGGRRDEEAEKEHDGYESFHGGNNYGSFYNSRFLPKDKHNFAKYAKMADYSSRRQISAARSDNLSPPLPLCDRNMCQNRFGTSVVRPSYGFGRIR